MVVFVRIAGSSSTYRTYWRFYKVLKSKNQENCSLSQSAFMAHTLMVEVSTCNLDICFNNDPEKVLWDSCNYETNNILTNKN